MNALDQLVLRLQKEIEFLKQADIDYRDNRETFFEKYHYCAFGNDVYDHLKRYEFILDQIMNRLIVPDFIINTYDIFDYIDEEILSVFPHYELKYITFNHIY